MNMNNVEPKAATLLEHCVHTQDRNADYLDNIQNRIVKLINKLSTKHDIGTAVGSDTDSKSAYPGVLVELESKLSVHANILSSVQADLDELEKLI